jgi:hypothetical protein
MIYQPHPAALRRIYSAPGMVIYAEDNGARYIVKPADPGPGHRPDFYVSYEAPEANAPVYLSGLFATNTPGVFSGDVTPRAGSKMIFLMQMNGDTATIQPLEAGAARPAMPTARKYPPKRKRQQRRRHWVAVA